MGFDSPLLAQAGSLGEFTPTGAEGSNPSTYTPLIKRSPNKPRRVDRRGAFGYIPGMKKIDARLYKFTPHRGPRPFGFMGLNGIEEVEVTNLEKTQYIRNGAHFSYYGTGTATESAGMLLDDDRILFCVVSGSRFTGTLHPAEKISMEYWMMTPLKPKRNKQLEAGERFR